MGKFEYSELYNSLNFKCGILVFLKKDGTPRVMLATRNLGIAEMASIKGSLSGRDRNCHIRNGSIAVFDLIKGEPRSFSVSRVLLYEERDIDTEEQFSDLVEEFLDFKEDYERGVTSTRMSMEDLEEVYHVSNSTEQG